MDDIKLLHLLYLIDLAAGNSLKTPYSKNKPRVRIKRKKKSKRLEKNKNKLNVRSSMFGNKHRRLLRKK